MTTPKKTSSQAVADTMRRDAVCPCRKAETAHFGSRPFSINALPDEECRAAHALLYAAIAHCLCAPRYRLPKTLRWQGRRWHLTQAGCGRLEVSAYPGCPGIVSMPGALL